MQYLSAAPPKRGFSSVNYSSQRKLSTCNEVSSTLANSNRKMTDDIPPGQEESKASPMTRLEDADVPALNRSVNEGPPGSSAAATSANDNVIHFRI